MATTGIYAPDIDGLMSAYTPVYDKDGNIYCAAGVDIRDNKFIVLKNELPLINTIRLLTMVIAALTGLFGVYLYLKKRPHGLISNAIPQKADLKHLA